MPLKALIDLTPSLELCRSKGATVTLKSCQTISVFGGERSGIGEIIKLLVDHTLGRENNGGQYSVEYHFERRRPGCLGVLFDDASWSLCNLRVDEEVAFVLENSGVEPAEMAIAVNDALEKVGLAGFGHRKISTLSGGELRKVALAAILVGKPNLILSDDLNGHLDLAALDQLEVVLKDYVKTNQACWVDFRRRWDSFNFPCEKFGVLERGALTVHQGEDAYEDGGGAGMPFGQELAQHLSSQLGATTPYLSSPQQAVHWLIEKKASIVSEAEPYNPGETLMEAIGIGFGYEQSNPLMQDLHLTLKRGHVYALSGKNGAGKSTLARILCGLYQPQTGYIKVNGQKGARSTLMRTGALVFQKPEYQFIRDSVLDELAVALSDGKNDASIEAISEIIETFGLGAYLESHPFSLSIGEKRRLSVACAIASNREFLVIDEPTLGQDEAQTRLLGKRIKMAARDNRSVLVITHDPEFIVGYCDEVLCLKHGMISDLGTPGEAFAQNSRSMFAGKSYLLEFWNQICAAGLAVGTTPCNLDQLRVVQ